MRECTGTTLQPSSIVDLKNFTVLKNYTVSNLINRTSGTFWYPSPGRNVTLYPLQVNFTKRVKINAVYFTASPVFPILGPTGFSAFAKKGGKKLGHLKTDCGKSPSGCLSSYRMDLFTPFYGRSMYIEAHKTHIMNESLVLFRIDFVTCQ